VTKRKIVVIGAGAAGLTAAGRLAELGGDVVLFEHGNRPGQKLAITGKGRCNLTNIVDLPEFLNHFHPHGRFLRQAFSAHFTEETIRFFDSIGVPTVTERGGRVFPADNQAKNVVEALVQWNNRNGVLIYQNLSVEKLLVESGKVTGVKTCKTEVVKNKIRKNHTTEQIFEADAVIVTTGGASYPATGSTGDGYRLAKAVGHTVSTIRPALVPLETAGDLAGKMKDLSLKNVTAKVWINGKKKNEAFGEMKFTKFGLTGPIILTLSGEVVDALEAGHKAALTIDLKPALDDKKLDARLLREFDQHGKRQFRKILKELMPMAMIPHCMENLGILPDKPGHQINAEDRKRLKNWLKELRFEISGYRPFSEAIITAGGIVLKEVDPKTMESRKVKDLYFAGEVLDIQADTGGYNLQAAFSTGRLAAESAISQP